MRILFCPTHYAYDSSTEGSELSWAYNIADRIGSLFPGSLVVTGKSHVGVKPYRIVEVTPRETRVNFGLIHALGFNVRYTAAAVRALNQGHFDVVHHVLPYAIGKTYNLAVLRRGFDTPFMIGPVQPPVAVRDPDLDPTDFKSHASRQRAGVSSLRRSTAHTIGAFVSDVVGPIALSGLARRTVNRAAVVIVVNDHTKALLVQSGVPPSRLMVIPPGIDTRRFKPADTRAARVGGLVLLSVSQLVKRKNVDVIIRAFADVAKGLPDAKLRIVGDGPERYVLTRLARSLGVQEKVSFTGFIPHGAVDEEYRRADVFVNASSWEGFATTCLEALACGLPVVSTPVGGFADAVEDGRNGYLIDRPDRDGLAVVLTRFAENPTLIADQSVRARELAERQFDWNTAVIPRYIEAYEGVIREHLRRDRP